MVAKILFLGIAIGGLLIVFATNWFWRWLAIPIVGIFAFDVINSYFDQKRREKDSPVAKTPKKV